MYVPFNTVYCLFNTAKKYAMLRGNIPQIMMEKEPAIAMELQNLIRNAVVG